MSLRGKLLLIALALLVLPLAAIQSTRQIEGFLREAKSEALLATAKALARSLPDLPPMPGDPLYVHVLQRPLQIDGYDDDWSQWRPFAQRISGQFDHFDLNLLLAGYERWIYVLAEVRDRTPDRATRTPEGLADGDHLVLQLLDSRGLNRYRIFPSASGGIELEPLGNAAASAPPVSGAWREQASGGGYRVELRLPASLLSGPLDLEAVDSGSAPGSRQRISTRQHPSIGALLWRDPQLSRWLNRRVPPGNRSWVLHPDGWVLGAGGELSTEPQNARAAGGWQRLAYRLLVGDALAPAVNRDPSIDLRLSGSEISKALAGEPSVSWRRTAGNRVVSSVAVPVDQGILVMESLADELLLATNRTARQVIGYSVIGVAAAVLALLAYATVLSLRVRRLRDAAEQLLQDDAGDGPLALPGSTASDELGDLARSYSGLLEELRTYNSYLRSLAGKLSHELNTPLAVVRSSLDNLADQQLPESARVYAERAREGADRLAAILRAMSEARRLEQSLQNAEMEPLDLSEVISGCVAGYRELDPKHQWELDLPQRAEMRGSPELLAQMLDKLADNARSFCPEDGSIRIVLKPVRHRWRLDFENDGPPLPEKLGGRIFQSLVSLRENQSTGMHLGLGLHIVRLVAVTHGGSVSAFNRPPDRTGRPGVVFRIWLRELPVA